MYALQLFSILIKKLKVIFFLLLDNSADFNLRHGSSGVISKSVKCALMEFYLNEYYFDALTSSHDKKVFLVFW